MMLYNFVLIVILCVGALTQRNKASTTSWPVHIMLLAISLFVPPQFLYVRSYMSDVFT